MSAETWLVLRDTAGLSHLPDADGEPACGYPDPVERHEHPMDAAGVWCSRCMEALTRG